MKTVIVVLVVVLAPTVAAPAGDERAGAGCDHAVCSAADRGRAEICRDAVGAAAGGSAGTGSAEPGRGAGPSNTGNRSEAARSLASQRDAPTAAYERVASRIAAQPDRCKVTSPKDLMQAIERSSPRQSEQVVRDLREFGAVLADTRAVAAKADSQRREDDHIRNVCRQDRQAQEKAEACSKCSLNVAVACDAGAVAPAMLGLAAGGIPGAWAGAQFGCRVGTVGGLLSRDCRTCAQNALSPAGKGDEGGKLGESSSSPTVGGAAVPFHGMR